MPPDRCCDHEALELGRRRGVRLTKYSIGEDIPPYEILSHTWGPDGEEVTFQDIQMRLARIRLDMANLVLWEQVSMDDLQYFWVETCDIYECRPHDHIAHTAAWLPQIP